MIALPNNVTYMAEAKAEYETEPKGFVQVPRALRQRCKKLSAGEWAVLMEVLDRGYSWGRYEPQKIKIEDFCESSGLTKRAIDNGISGLTARGVLYEERTGTSKTSASRYAIIDASNPESGPYTTSEDVLVINLLGGLVYPVNPVFLKSRKTKRNPTKQENVILQSRKSNPTLSENTQSRQPAQQDAPSPIAARLKNVSKEKKKEVVSASSSEERLGSFPPLPVQNETAPSSDSHTTPAPEQQPLVEALYEEAGSKEKTPAPPARKGRLRTLEPKPRAPNPLYEVWCQHAPPEALPQSEAEIANICKGLNTMKRAELPGKPLVEELPALMAEVMSWGDGYFPDPYLMNAKIGKIRYNIKHKQTSSRQQKGATSLQDSYHYQIGKPRWQQVEKED